MEKVKTRISGVRCYSSTGDFRKGQNRSRGSKECKDEALMEESEFSGASVRDIHVYETAISTWVKRELGQDRAQLQSATTSIKHSRMPLTPGEDRAELFLPKTASHLPLLIPGIEDVHRLLLLSLKV